MIVATHSALQGAMVCHLADTTKVGHQTKAQAKKWLYWHDSNREAPAPADRMASPKELFARLGDRDKRMGCAGSVLTGLESHTDNIEILFELRNEIVHFDPKSLTIGIDLIAEICSCAAIVVQMIVKDGYAFRHLACEELNQLTERLNNLKELLEKSD